MLNKEILRDKNVVWEPQPKQVAFLERAEYECLYGGAAGGGKSDAMLAEALRQVRIPHYRAIIFRKTFPQLAELIDRSQTIYSLVEPRARYNQSSHVWHFPSGAKIEFGTMQHEKDRLNYQGRRYDFIGFDELTHFTWQEYSYMFSRNRPSKNPKSQAKTRVYIRGTANPGGVGHDWVKARFITASKPFTPITEDVEILLPDGSREIRKRNRVFIPATVFDNRKLLEEDPNYVARLALLPEKERNALLYGDWDSFTGQFFTEFRITPDLEAAKAAGIKASADDLQAHRQFVHVIDPFDLSKGECRGWNIVRAYDFGYAKPFSCGWYAIDYDGVAYRILEYYGCTKTPNEGLKLIPDEQFRQIAEIEETHPWLKGRKIEGVADPAIWDASHGEKIAETAMKHGIYFVPGDNKRISGWMQCHYRLQFDKNGYPRMYVFNTCKDFIRTIPAMLYDDSKPEDLDSSLEDHIADEWRYFCMSRPIEPMRPIVETTILNDPLNQFKDSRRKRWWDR